MSEVVIATSEADATAAQAVEQHHAEMAGALRLHVETLFTAASQGDTAAAETARRDLVDWCERDLVPHALAEERAMYPAAQATVEGRLLVDAMLGEHQVITGLVREVAEASDLLRAAASARALSVVFDSHLSKENHLIVPLLVATPGISMASLFEGMHELLGGEGRHAGAEADPDDQGSGGCGGHACACGEVDSPGYPELDVRAIPHAIRHATVFGALESVRPGAGLELVAHHDPLPLLDQVQARWPGVFSVSYTERGPEAWRLNLVRASS